MNFLKVTGTAALFLCLGTLLPVYAQHEGKAEEKEARPAAPQARPKPYRTSRIFWSFEDWSLRRPDRDVKKTLRSGETVAGTARAKTPAVA